MIDVDYVTRLLAARCPELGPGDLAAIERALAGHDDATGAITAEIGERIVAVLDAFDARLERIEDDAA